jgi:methyl coenzyme M reductase subunit C-like uncharacterized protein (methanogenesis marker protein 7)
MDRNKIVKRLYVCVCNIGVAAIAGNKSDRIRAADALYDRVSELIKEARRDGTTYSELSKPRG